MQARVRARLITRWLSVKKSNIFIYCRGVFRVMSQMRHDYRFLRKCMLYGYAVLSTFFIFSIVFAWLSIASSFWYWSVSYLVGLLFG